MQALVLLLRNKHQYMYQYLINMLTYSHKTGTFSAWAGKWRACYSIRGQGFTSLISPSCYTVGKLHQQMVKWWQKYKCIDMRPWNLVYIATVSATCLFPVTLHHLLITKSTSPPIRWTLSHCVANVIATYVFAGNLLQ